MRRARNVKIVATLGPASETKEMIMALHKAGADVFRLNMSHGSHDEIRELVNDGKIRLQVKACGADFADCEVVTGGVISNRKGVNVPDVVLPLAALSDKDRADLDFVCDLGVDWLALSFVQRPADVEEARGSR